MKVGLFVYSISVFWVFLMGYKTDFSLKSALEYPKPDRHMEQNEKMKITIGTSTFNAELEDNETAKAFTEQLPLTLTMIELNGNEKYIDLSAKLPTNTSNPGKIEKGDIMLFGSRTLVIFYKSFSTSYSYSRIGRILNPDNLENVLGPGNVRVLFEKV